MTVAVPEVYVDMTARKVVVPPTSQTQLPVAVVVKTAAGCPAVPVLMGEQASPLQVAPSSSDCWKVMVPEKVPATFTPTVFCTAQVGVKTVPETTCSAICAQLRAVHAPELLAAFCTVSGVELALGPTAKAAEAARTDNTAANLLKRFII